MSDIHELHASSLTPSLTPTWKEEPERPETPLWTPPVLPPLPPAAPPPPRGLVLGAGAAASSSSLAAGKTFALKLFDSKGIFVATVDVPWPLPALILYQGNYYAYSYAIYSRYVQVVPYTPTTDLGAPALSPLAFPAY